MIDVNNNHQDLITDTDLIRTYGNSKHPQTIKKSSRNQRKITLYIISTILVLVGGVAAFAINHNHNAPLENSVQPINQEEHIPSTNTTQNTAPLSTGSRAFPQP